MKRIFEVEQNPFPRSVVKKPVYRASSRQGIRQRLKGIYFADEPKTKSFGKFVIKAYVNIQNPFYFAPSDIEDIVYALPKEAIRKFSKFIYETDMYDPEYDDPYDVIIEELGNGDDYQIHQSDEFIEEMKRQGFDGILSTDSFGGYDEYVVFSTDQIHILEEYQV